MPRACHLPCHSFLIRLRSSLSGCHATLPRKYRGALRDIPKDGCEGDHFLIGQLMISNYLTGRSAVITLLFVFVPKPPPR